MRISFRQFWVNIFFCSFFYIYILCQAKIICFRVKEGCVFVADVNDSVRRPNLLGQKGLYARSLIPKNTIIGAYTGELWNEHEYLKHIHSNCIHYIFFF